MPLYLYNGGLLRRGNALAASEDCCCCPDVGFKAFDGSNRYFKKMTIYDIDCCYLEYPPLKLPRSRKTDPAISDPDDGYYTLQKTCDNQCIVTNSVRWYSVVVPVGSIAPCPIYGSSAYSVQIPFPAGWRQPPDPIVWTMWKLLNTPLKSATFMSFIIDSRCCNADGSRCYVQLTEEIFDNIL